MLLADKGYRVLKASSGEETWNFSGKKTDINVVLVDLKMPGMSGLDLYRSMVRTGSTPPFIIMTAYATVETAIMALKEGVADYLIKPLNYEELPIVLANVCRQAEMRLELTSLRRQVREESTFPRDFRRQFRHGRYFRYGAHGGPHGRLRAYHGRDRHRKRAPGQGAPP